MAGPKLRIVCITVSLHYFLNLCLQITLISVNLEFTLHSFEGGFLREGNAVLESTVTARGQTTLPKSVRASLGLTPGDRVRYIVVGKEVRLIRARSVMELAGMLHRPGMTAVSLTEMAAAIAAGALDAAT